MKKQEGPVTSMEYFGLTIDTINYPISLLRTTSKNQHIKLPYPHP